MAVSSRVKILLANCIPVTQLMQARVTRPLTESKGPQLPKILYKIVQFSKDCKIVTSPKHLLYATRGVTCDHVICRSFRTLIHKNLQRDFRKFYREMVFKDCRAERDCKFLVKISGRLYKIVKSCGPLTESVALAARSIKGLATRD